MDHRRRRSDPRLNDDRIGLDLCGTNHYGIRFPQLCGMGRTCQFSGSASAVWHEFAGAVRKDVDDACCSICCNQHAEFHGKRIGKHLPGHGKNEHDAAGFCKD